jgi:hypothetical protein
MLRNIANYVVVPLTLSLCVGKLMDMYGYTTDAGYFWQRQIVIWMVLLCPLAVRLLITQYKKQPRAPRP